MARSNRPKCYRRPWAYTRLRYRSFKFRSSPRRWQPEMIPCRVRSREPRSNTVKREILITGSQRETRVAILEDDRLVELLVDHPETSRTLGNIYHGKVEAVLPGIQAAFVDIGTGKSAFLHASDLVEPDEDDDDEAENGRGNTRASRKVPNVQDVLTRGQNLLVQVIKEPISTKGPRVTAQVSI